MCASEMEQFARFAFQWLNAWLFDLERVCTYFIYNGANAVADSIFCRMPALQCARVASGSIDKRAFCRSQCSGGCRVSLCRFTEWYAEQRLIKPLLSASMWLATSYDAKQRQAACDKAVVCERCSRNHCQRHAPREHIFPHCKECVQSRMKIERKRVLNRNKYWQSPAKVVVYTSCRENGR